MLREPVQRQDRRGVHGTGVRDVGDHAGGELMMAMGDAGEFWWPWHAQGLPGFETSRIIASRPRARTDPKGRRPIAPQAPPHRRYPSVSPRAGAGFSFAARRI